MTDADPQRPATVDDVAAICASLPDTELGISWGDRPTWKVPRGDKGKGFVIHRAPGKTALKPDGTPYDDLLVIRVPDPGAKQALVAGDGPFFSIEHFKNYNAVLVQKSRLGELDLAELREVLTDAWCTVAPRQLVREFTGE